MSDPIKNYITDTDQNTTLLSQLINVVFCGTSVSKLYIHDMRGIVLDGFGLDCIVSRPFLN